MYLSFMYSESQIMQLTYPATIFQHVKGYAKLPTTARTLVWGNLSKKKKKMVLGHKGKFIPTSPFKLVQKFQNFFLGGGGRGRKKKKMNMERKRK